MDYVLEVIPIEQQASQKEKAPLAQEAKIEKEQDSAYQEKYGESESEKGRDEKGGRFQMAGKERKYQSYAHQCGRQEYKQLEDMVTGFLFLAFHRFVSLSMSAWNRSFIAHNCSC